MKDLGQRRYLNPILQILWYIKIGGQSCYPISSDPTRYDLEIGQAHCPNILETVSRILNSRVLLRVMWYFLDHGAATDLILQHKTGLPESSVKWARRQLQAMKIIQPAIHLQKDLFSKRGPRPTVWMIEEALPGQVRDAVLLHYRLRSPKYRIALQIAQTLLDEYISKRSVNEVTYREILLQVKRLNIPFNTSDIAELTAQYLVEKGVRIWR